MAHAQSDGGGGGGTNIVSNKNTTAIVISTSTAAEEIKTNNATVFHDFLGKGSVPDSSLLVGAAAGKVRQQSEASPSASLSIGASSGGGRGPISTTSDIGSERHTGSHFEGVPFYGQRSELIGPETSNTFIGTKRSNSDSYVGTSRERFPQMRPDSIEGSQLMKLLRNAGGERPRRPHDEESSLPMHLIRPISASLVSQPSPGFRADANNAKFDRGVQMNVGQTWQYPRSGQVVPFGNPSLSNKLRDSNLPPVASQGAADEGSRTGIKGSGILSSVNTSSGFSDRITSGVLLCSSKQKSNCEPESSTGPSRQGIGTSAGCQMTIFYGGQAHVFDNVHPNKADIIMALAGSNGGSWSSSYTPKGIGRPNSGENCTAGGKTDIGAGSSSFSLQPEVQAKSSVRVSSFHGLSSGDGVITQTGNLQEGSTTKEPKTSTRNAEYCGDNKRT